MSVNNYRKCAKCGITRVSDMSVSYHRFPCPGTTNIVKARAWATYCWPDQDWSVESLNLLYKRSKVLCGRHFSFSQFYDSHRQRLNKFAVPESTSVQEILNQRENVFVQRTCARLLQPSTSTVMDASAAQSSGEDTSDVTFTEQSQTTAISPQANIDYTQRHVGQSSSTSPITPDPKGGKFTWQELDAPEVISDEDSDVDSKRLDMDVTSFECVRSDKRALPQTVDAATNTVPLHEGFQCNHCHSDIIGFRYTCVQCADYDLCAACEARRAHAAHYALRVPAPRPQAEIAAVLQTIRDALRRDAIVTGFQALDEMSLKPEKIEELDSEYEQETLNIDEDRIDVLQDPIGLTERNSDSDGGDQKQTDLSETVEDASDAESDHNKEPGYRNNKRLGYINQQMDTEPIDTEERCSNPEIKIDHVDSKSELNRKQTSDINEKVIIDKNVVKHKHLDAKIVKCGDKLITLNGVSFKIINSPQVNLQRCNLKPLGFNIATVSGIGQSFTKSLDEHSAEHGAKKLKLDLNPINKAQTINLTGEVETLPQCKRLSPSPRQGGKQVRVLYKQTRKKT